MEENQKHKSAQMPVYQKIAADIAAKIAEKKYHVGEKIYSRSVIASQYAVSPETARKAISILADLEIVSSVKGSGVTILSYEKAAKFLVQFNDVQTIQNQKKELLDIMTNQKREFDRLNEKITDFVESTSRFRMQHPFTPFEFEIDQALPCIGKTLGELHFWQHTAATVIAIRRDGNTMISPGSYATLCKNDIIYFIGDDLSLERVKAFLIDGQG